MKQLILAAILLLTAVGGNAQTAKDPSTWTIKTVPGKGIYDVVFDVKLEPGWHIWALDAGGDGTLIAPSFSFDQNGYTLFGKTTELGFVTEETMEGMDGKVRFFKNKVQFIQSLRANSGTPVKGSYTYQLCSDKMCLPPKTVPFELKIH